MCFCVQKALEMRKYGVISLFLLLTIVAKAQMNIGGKILFGNEWIEYDKTYLKISIKADGIYKLDYNTLIENGFPTDFKGAQLKLISGGEERPILTTTEDLWTEDQYLLFYGEPNDGFLDQFHYEDWENEQLNPKYSMYADERIYYLTVSNDGEQNLRYQELENDLSDNSLPAEAFYMHREEKVFGEFNWSPVAPDVPEIQNSSFIVSEGFGTRMLSSHDINFELSSIFPDAGTPYLDIRAGSNIQPEHIIHISLNNQLLEIDTFQSLKVSKYNIPFDRSLLRESNVLNYQGVATSDNSTIAHAAIVYPREFDASGSRYFSFEIAEGTEEKYYEIKRFSAGGQNYVFDVNNNRFVRPVTQSGVAKFKFDNTDGRASQLVLVAAQLGLKTPTIVGMKSFSRVETLNPEYLILTSEELNNGETTINPIEEYATFRESSEGGAYTTAIVNVEELYDQFAYGIDNHSLAIKNFAQYVKPLWPDFEMVFIIGKALSYGNKNKNTPIKSFVPTYGRPGSDVLLFAERNQAPFIGVGRLAARDKQDVFNYLEKVKTHASIFDVTGSSIEDREWLKQIIHLSGGDPGIQQDIFNHLKVMEDIIEGVSFGANVNTFRKISSDPIQTSLSQEILNRINKGIAMLTFFGHSSAGTFDFSVEDPSIYENEGRLPLIFSMGCRSGDIHETVFSLSENMILTEGKGAIAFVASSGSAFPTPLSGLGELFYEKLSQDFYGEPIGLVLKTILERFNNPNFTKIRTLLEQNTLHGDPALTLYKADGPDYIVDLSTVTTNGVVGATDENINLEFDIVNLGKGVTDSLTNWIIHEYSTGIKDTTVFKSVAPSNRISVELQLPNPGFDAIGKNVIEIVLDVGNKISEYPLPAGENNNTIKQAYNAEGYCFYIFDDSAFPVYPPNFGIVNNPDLKLIASSTNALGEKDTYVLQIDTTELFNSSLMVETQLVSSPAAIKWDPNIKFENNTVYYWRVAPLTMDSSIWNTSSFIFLEEYDQGWNQSHLYQWQKDRYENYSFDDEKREFLFAQNLNEISITNGAYPQYAPLINVQNNPIYYLNTLSDGEIPSGFYITVLDPVTALPWLNDPSPDGGLYDSELYTWWAEDYPIFPYRTDTPENRAKIINFLENEVPDEAYVIMFTIQRRDYPGIGNYRADEWAGDASIHPDGKDLMSLIESFGATRVRELEAGPKPYIFAFRKNDSEFAPQEVIADNIDASINLDLRVLGSWFEGKVKSTRIGPAKSWNKVLWNLEDYNLDEDEYEFNIYGVLTNGEDSILYKNVQDFEIDISSVNSEVFPYLRLEFYSKDETSKTSAQMPYWRVLYEAQPEAIIDIPEKFTFNSDTLFLGEKLMFSSLATNVTETDMDSLLVRYTVVDPDNKEHTDYQRLAPLTAGNSLELNYEYTNEDNLGINQFIVEINPNKDQVERYEFNNTGVLSYSVQGDRINPILDLTFDGMRILDGDIVSPTPHIRIELRDENQYLRLNSMSSFEISLKKEPENQASRIDLEESDVIFTPADTTGDNVAVLEFFPELESGEYTIYVQAKDLSGNVSGDQEIEIRFNVIEDTRVSNVLNYPNPFSTSTQFIFTLTGYELPEVFTIQIMTLSGKVVREITKEELGNLRIGLNRTDFRWDGTDEYGSRLANGVYIYRVLTSFNDNTSSHFDNESIDSFFKEGFGKLVIMR